MTQYYDAHCHIFNKDFLLRNLANIAMTLSEISDKEHIKDNIKLLRKTLEKIGPGLKTETMGFSKDVFEVLDKAYNNEFIVTPLSMNLVYVDDNDGTSDQNKKYIKQLKRFLGLINMIVKIINGFTLDKEVSKLLKEIVDDIAKFKKFLDKAKPNQWIINKDNYIDQISEHAQLAEENKRVKPFLAIDPRTQRNDGQNLIELLDKYFNVAKDKRIFLGVKIYAPIGFSPTDPILMGDENNKSIYQYCIDKSIPITVHNSNTGFSCFSKELNVTGWVYYREKRARTYKLKYLKNEKIHFKTKFFSLKINEAIAERAKVLNHPVLWKKVLEKFPKLSINFGHFGGSSQIMERINYSFPDTFIDIDEYAVRKMMDKVKTKDEKDKIWDAFIDIDGVFNIKRDITENERKELWEILYKAGVVDNWTQAIFDIIIKYPNAYTDLSCFRSFDKKGDTGFIKNLSKFKMNFFDPLIEKHKAKFLYGTDFFLIQLSGINPKDYLDTFKTVFQIGKDFDLIASKNPEKFLGIRN